MRKGICITCFFACVIVTELWGVPVARGQSSSSPVPLGVRAATTVDDMDIFNPSPPAEIGIALLQMRRAGDAWELIRKADAGNRPAPEGFDYILALVKFEYGAREGTAHGKAYELRTDEFVAASAEGKWYEVPAVVLPKPALKTSLAPGESSEGWAAFLVPQQDKKPRLFFSRGNLWFQLH